MTKFKSQDKNDSDQSTFSKKDIEFAENKIMNYVGSPQGFERALLGWIRDEYQKNKENKGLTVRQLMDEADILDRYVVFWRDEMNSLLKPEDGHVEIKFNGYTFPIDVINAANNNLNNAADNNSGWRNLCENVHSPIESWDLTLKNVSDASFNNPISTWLQADVSSRILKLDASHVIK